MSVTFNQPVRIYKYNNPTNNGVIAPDNSGAAVCTQESYILNPISAANSGTVTFSTADVGTTTATPFVLPAGSIIENVTFYQTTSAANLAGGVVTVSLTQPSPTGGSNTVTSIGTITPSTTGGIINISFTQSAAVANVISNVGTLDATLTFAAANVTALTAGSISGVFQAQYTARNYTGSIINVGQGYTNS
jgi:hypothetical protein